MGPLQMPSGVSHLAGQERGNHTSRAVPFGRRWYLLGKISHAGERAAVSNLSLEVTSISHHEWDWTSV